MHTASRNGKWQRTFGVRTTTSSYDGSVCVSFERRDRFHSSHKKAGKLAVQIAGVAFYLVNTNHISGCDIYGKSTAIIYRSKPSEQQTSEVLWFCVLLVQKIIYQYKPSSGPVKTILTVAIVWHKFVC